MAAWLPAYLLHGDDHDRLSERRSKLRAAAEGEVGPDGIELFEGDSSQPAVVATALQSMTIGIGRRFLIVEGVERWKDADLKQDLLPALAHLDGSTTTIAFVAFEEKRYTVPKSVIESVTQLGGAIVNEQALKAKDLPRWAVAKAAELGINLDGVAAQVLVGHVGERRVRIERELEKLALEYGHGAQIGANEINETIADASEQQVWALVDCIAAKDRIGATASYLALRNQKESLQRLIGLLNTRFRTALEIAQMLDSGQSPADVGAGLKMQPWMKDRRIAEARQIGSARLAEVVDRLARLELDSRGDSPLDPDTEAIRLIGAVTRP